MVGQLKNPHRLTKAETFPHLRSRGGLFSNPRFCSPIRDFVFQFETLFFNPRLFQEPNLYSSIVEYVVAKSLSLRFGIIVYRES